MLLKVSNQLEIENPTKDIWNYCEEKLTLTNPDYLSAERAGRWTGKIDPKIYLYYIRGNTLVLPFGCLKDIWKYIDSYETNFHAVWGNKLQGGINLYDYQENAIQAILRAKGGILEAPCGSGKTNIGLELIHRNGGRALWLTHTQKLLEQSMQRCKDYFTGDFGTITEGKVHIGGDITFATVQTMSKLDVSVYKDAFDIVVVDECFPAHTKVLTNNGYEELQNLNNGDIIASYNTRTKEIEYKPVTHIFKLKAHDIVKVKLSNGKEIVCTNNHPFYTQNGEWKSAGELRENDYVMQYLWQGDRYKSLEELGNNGSKKERKSLLFSNLRFNSKVKANEESKRETKSNYHRKNENKQSYEEQTNKRESFSKIKRNWASSKDKMWEWNGNDCSTTNFDARTCEEYGNLRRISYSNKNGKRFRISNLLQSRYSNSRKDDRNRSGWKFSLFNRKTKSGQEERNIFEWIRVENIEIQKQTSDGTFGRLCEDGFVYNIEVADNNNYFVDDILVHNCHHCSGSPTKMMQFYKVVTNCNARYKYGLSATLSRADGMIQSVYSVLGNVSYTIPKSAVGDKIIKAIHSPVMIDLKYSIRDYINSDGTINHIKLMNMLSYDSRRNDIIIDKVREEYEKGRKQIILCHRVAQAEELQRRISRFAKVNLLIGKVGSKHREYDANIIIATYSLAKEGLDIPALDVLHLATPQKNASTTEQAVGRIERNIQGKSQPICYDYVDTNVPYCMACYKKRRAILKRH